MSCSDRIVLDLGEFAMTKAANLNRHASATEARRTVQKHGTGVLKRLDLVAALLSVPILCA